MSSSHARHIRIRKPSAWFGAFMGVHLAFFLTMSLASALLVPSPARAQEDVATGEQTRVATCFYRNECLAAGTTTNCDKENCFEQGHGCPGEQGGCYTNPPAIPLIVHIGGKARVLNIGDYIGAVYDYGVAIAGILAGVIIVIGGVQYLTAGGNDSQIKHAKERIKNALI